MADPWAVQSEVDEDPWAVVSTKPAKKPKKRGGIVDYVAKEVGGAVSGAAKQFADDAKRVWTQNEDDPNPLRNPVAAARDAVEDIGATGKMVLSAGNLALSPVTGAVNAFAVKPTAAVMAKTPGGKYARRAGKWVELEGEELQAENERVVGNAFTALGPGKAVPVRAAAPKPTPRNAFAENVEAFDKAGVRPSVAAMGDGRARIAKGIAENPIAGIRSRNALRASMDDTGAAAERIAGEYGAPSASRGAAGETVQAGVKGFNQRFSERASKMYDSAFAEIDAGQAAAVQASQRAAALKTGKGGASVSPAPVVEPSATRAALGELGGRVNAAPLSQIITDPRLSRIANALETGAQNLRFGDLRALRTWVREAKSNEQLRQGLTQAGLGRLESGLTADIYANVERLAGPKALRKIKQSDSFYRLGSQRIEDALQKFVGKGQPTSGESAYDLVVRAASDKGGADTARLTALKKSLQSHEWNDVAATVISRLGKATPGTAEQGNFSISRFVTNYESLSPQGRDLLFGTGPLRSELDNLNRVAGMQKRVEKAANTSNTAAGAQALTTVVGLANPKTMVPTAGILSGMAITGEMMTNPLVVRWLVRLGRARQQGGAALQTQVKALGNAANDNAALMPLAVQARALAGESAAISAPIAAEETPESR